ncbi:MAG: ChbG/HpnK family deacetylase [Deltaproteobacteria bacterium]|nr:ChbG/HpnK family deacetylase [Deltaproteobacteria bacterium]
MSKSSPQIFAVINADDLGLNSQVNEAVISGIGQGFITDASLMVKAPKCTEAVAELKKIGFTSLGIHIDLDYTLGWSSPGIEHHSRTKLDRLLRQKEFLELLRQEAGEQVALFLSHGLRPSHIDTHHHVHGFAPIFNILLELMEEYMISAIRFSPDGYSLPTREDIPFHGAEFASMESKLQEKGLHYCHKMIEGVQRLDQAEAGFNEIVVHPAVSGDSWRVKELEILMSSEFQEIIDSQGIELISFEKMVVLS